MSENKPENAGTPGTPSPSGQPAEGSKLDTAPAAPQVSLPTSHEDAIQSPLKGLPAQAPEPTVAAEEAALRSSTDDPVSASTVSPEDPAKAQQRDAAEARASAAESTAQQEAAVHKRDAARGTPASSTQPSAQARPKAAGATDSSASPESAAARGT
ncbi:MAG: peptidase C26, partial [Paraburkholderia sp.]